VLPPQFPDTATAVAEGKISARHAGVVTRAVEQLPDEIVDELGGWVETHLVEHARGVDAMALARYARSLIDRLDQDGTYRELDYQHKRRELRLFDRPDGSCRIEGYCTAEAAEHLRVFFDAMAAPRPAADGARDPRSAGQRRHDALLELVQMAMRTGQLPNAGGMSATIVLTMDAETYATGVGTATTGHGYTLPGRCRQDLGRRGGAGHRRAATRHTAHRGLLAHPTLLHRTTTLSTVRARPRMHLPRLRPPTRLVPNPPRHRAP
jgi:hypothetical protein